MHYTNRLIRTDSIIHVNYKFIYENIKNEYDIPQLIEERDETIKILKEDNQIISEKNKWIIIISVLFSVFMLGGFIYNYRLKKKYEKIIGSKPLKNVTVHCGSGVTACHTLCVHD